MYYFMFFFFTETATTEIYTLSLHDALPIWSAGRRGTRPCACRAARTRRRPRRRSGAGRSARCAGRETPRVSPRSEEHTSELQSHVNLVCRLLLEKKKKKKYIHHITLKYLML